MSPRIFIKRANILILIFGCNLSQVGYCHLKSGQYPAIRGTFIQYQSWMIEKLSQKDWENELEAMKNAGVQTIVIQWNQMNSIRFFPVHVPGVDPTEIILNFADRNRMKVLLGLRFNEEWWTKWGINSFLKEEAEQSEEFARLLWQRYQKHPSLSGWYLPYEMRDRDYDEYQIRILREFFGSMAHSCKTLSKRPLDVAFSTFFGKSIPPNHLEAIYQKILKKTGLSILIVQDGVGENGWYEKVGETIGPYLRAYQRAASSNGIKTWVAVESFQANRNSKNEAVRSPTKIELLLEQTKVAASYSDLVITFDFFHYMSPHRNPAARILYDEYLRTKVTRK